MSPETAQIIKDQLASLPEAVRKVISQTDVSAELLKLKNKHSLMLDQMTSLELDTRLTMIGIEDGDEFIENIKEHVGLTEEKAVAVAEDIENSIFSKIRTAMMSETDERDLKEIESTEEPLNKDSILAEIENPTPTFQPKAPTTPVNTEKIPENLPTIRVNQVLESYTPPSLPVKNIVEKKLSEPTRIPPKEIEVSLKKIPDTLTQTASPSKSYTADPYKEPIV